MNALKLGVGVDVSLTELVVLTRPGSRLLRRTYPNTLTGIRHLVRDLLRAAAAIRQEAGLDEDVMPVLVVAEATGNMHVRLENALFDADVPFSLVQPLKAKRYAQMKGGRSKSDRVDAEMLSGYALEIAPEPTMPPSRERQQIKQLVSTHRALVEESTRLTNQIHALKSHPEPNRDCLKAYSTLLASVQREKQRIDKAMNAALAASYGSEMRLLLSVKGIGPGHRRPSWPMAATCRASNRRAS